MELFLRSMANTLRKNSSLTVLALGTHENGDDGCEALADLLANNHTREQLEIDKSDRRASGSWHTDWRGTRRLR
jgi:hypothetical protein